MPPFRDEPYGRLLHKFTLYPFNLNDMRLFNTYPLAIQNLQTDENQLESRHLSTSYLLTQDISDYTRTYSVEDGVQESKE